MIHTPKMDVLCTFFPVQGRYSSPSPPTQNHFGRGGSNLVSICYGQFDTLASYDDIVKGLLIEPGGAMKAINSLLVCINTHTTILGSQMVYPYVLIWVGGVFAHPPKIENNSISSLFRDFDSFLSYFSI